jgi:polyisoprenoid-binding protein YceI
MTAVMPTTETTTYAIDASHSLAEFAIKHMMISAVKGTFSDISGEVVIDEEDFANSSVSVDIETASISTRDQKRDDHLRSADFFDAETYPTMHFESTAVRPIDSERFTLVGNLTINGATRPVEIRAKRTGAGVTPWGQHIVGFEGDTVISRKDFGLTWNVALEAGGFLVGDEVKIHLEIEAARQ